MTGPSGSDTFMTADSQIPVYSKITTWEILRNVPVAIVVIATDQYLQFFPPLAASLRKYFAPELEPTIILCTDRSPDPQWHRQWSDQPYGLMNHWIYIAHEPWPMVTLRRYQTLVQCYNFGYLPLKGYVFHLDVDMLLVNPVKPEIFQNIVAVEHPGYWSALTSEHPRPWLPHEAFPGNPFYVPPEKRLRYYAGGFQGGRTEKYLEVCLELADRIEHAIRAGKIPAWHDESAWNWYLNQHPPLNPLNPEYCYAEGYSYPDLTPRILALTKPGFQKL